MKFFSLIFLFFFCAILGCGNSGSSSEQVPKTSGLLVYKRYCISCHGADGQLALGGAANLAVSTLSRDSALVVIQKGRKLMSAYESILNRDEMESVADYILTLRQDP